MNRHDMSSYYLLSHQDWEEPRKIFYGPNSNAESLGPEHIQTIGSSPQCKWFLPDMSLPGIVALLIHDRYHRGYICELNPEDYGSTKREDFLKRIPVLNKAVTGFEVAGYNFLLRHSGLMDVENLERPSASLRTASM